MVKLKSSSYTNTLEISDLNARTANTAIIEIQTDAQSEGG